MVMMSKYNAGRSGLQASLRGPSVDVLGRAVDRVELEHLAAAGADIVPRTLRHDDAVIGLNVVVDAVDGDRADAGLDAEELVTVVVDFFAYLLHRLDYHQDELEAVAGIEHLAEQVVRFGQSFDVVDKALHRFSPSLADFERQGRSHHASHFFGPTAKISGGATAPSAATTCYLSYEDY